MTGLASLQKRLSRCNIASYTVHIKHFNTKDHQGFYPTNKIWYYRTKLAKPIMLNKPYKVGVIELRALLR